MAALGVVVACIAAPAAARVQTDPPLLIGSNYAHFSINACSLDNGGVVASGAQRMALIQAQLSAMREAGIQSLRTIVWQMHDATGQQWGIVSSAGGHMNSANSLQFIAYLKLVRALGFTQLTLAMGPEWANDPVTPSNPWDPSLFDENWHFLQYVRGLAKKYGPSTVHFDLMNEGAPSDYWSTKARVEDYLSRMYTNYVNAYGNSDVTVSAIDEGGDISTLANLITTLQATGKPLPTWFEVHSYGDPLQGLQDADQLLTDDGLDQPLVLGETYYDDATEASAIQSYLSSSSRPLLEAMAWPLVRGSGACPSPPYYDDKLYNALTGSAPQPTDIYAHLTSSGMTMKTADGLAVAGLPAGAYTLHVQVDAAGGMFQLTGPGLVYKTARTATRSVILNPATYMVMRNGSGQMFRVFSR